MTLFYLTLSYGFHSSFTKNVKTKFVSIRFLYEVRHSLQKRTFYIPLDKNEKQAVLHYRINKNIMDLRAINVPSKFIGQGIAKLLTETAFTFAIVNSYYLYLTCLYTQNYYLANKNRALSQSIIGPKEILDKIELIDPECFEELPDPEENYDIKKP